MISTENSEFSAKTIIAKNAFIDINTVLVVLCIVLSGPGLLVDVPRDKNITGTGLQAFSIAFLACLSYVSH